MNETVTHDGMTHFIGAEPVTAIQWTGSNEAEVVAFVGDEIEDPNSGDFAGASANGLSFIDCVEGPDKGHVMVCGKNGYMRAEPGDWIVRRGKGDFCVMVTKAWERFVIESADDPVDDDSDGDGDDCGEDGADV